MRMRSYFSSSRLQEGACVGGDHRETGVVAEAEEAAPHGSHRGIYLDAVDVRLRVVDAEGARGGAAGVAQDGDTRRGTAEKRRRREEHVPLTPGEHRVRPPHGVDRVALIQVKKSHVAGLHDLDELVAGLLFEQESRAVLDHPRRNGEQARDGGHRDEARHQPSAWQQRQRGGGDDRRRAQQRALRADELDGNESRQEGAHDAAGRGQREDATGDPTGVAYAGGGEADGERRHHAEQDHRRREQYERGGERAHDGSGGHGVDALHRQLQEGVGQERHGGDQRGRHDDDDREERRRGVAIGQTAAQPVAERE